MKIKDLQWDAFGRSYSPIGTYEVMCIAKGGVFGARFPQTPDTSLYYDHEGSEADCIAACQAHFEAAIRSALVEPEGWQLVPVEATQKMMEAGQSQRNCKAQFDLNDAFHVYRAMLAAAKETGQ
jgi:hypothetical protein